jgi:MgtC family
MGIHLQRHQKPTGMRTLGLVALASAVAVLAVAKDPDADASRVIQGVVTGVGFLGAGVIVHRGRSGEMVHGLATAATIWITASLGVLMCSRRLAATDRRVRPCRLPVDRRRPRREVAGGTGQLTTSQHHFAAAHQR